MHLARLWRLADVPFERACEGAPAGGLLESGITKYATAALGADHFSIAYDAPSDCLWQPELRGGNNS